MDYSLIKLACQSVCVFSVGYATRSDVSIDDKLKGNMKLNEIILVGRYFTHTLHTFNDLASTRPSLTFGNSRTSLVPLYVNLIHAFRLFVCACVRVRAYVCVCMCVY